MTGKNPQHTGKKIRRYTGSLQLTPWITQTTARCRPWHTGKKSI